MTPRECAKHLVDNKHSIITGMQFGNAQEFYVKVDSMTVTIQEAFLDPRSFKLCLRTLLFFHGFTMEHGNILDMYEALIKVIKDESLNDFTISKLPKEALE